jgi:Zn-finger nucleic acid-binding protein
MNCPRGCSPSLVSETIDALEVDRCPECRGLWLDQGEGEVITKPDPQSVIDELAGLDPADTSKDTSPPLACPRCTKTMGRERFAHSHVHIDRCGCGVWLDEGELEKIRAWRQEALEDLKTRHGTGGYPPGELERAFSRVYFDVGTPRAR